MSHLSAPLVIKNSSQIQTNNNNNSNNQLVVKKQQQSYFDDGFEQQEQHRDVVIEDMLTYPKAEEEVIASSQNTLLRIDSTAELLLASLRRNQELGFSLTKKQIELLKEISLFVPPPEVVPAIENKKSKKKF